MQNKGTTSTHAPKTLVSSPTTRVAALGYLAFPPPGCHAFSYSTINDKSEDINVQESRADQEGVTKLEEKRRREAAVNAEDERQERLRQERRAREAEEARKGEEDWVRSGGVLRDTEGRRDWTRTHAIREELKLREIERKAQERWGDYEGRWSEVMAKLKKEKIVLRFEDVPWPVKRDGAAHGDNRPLNLSVGNVEEFLLETLSVRGTTVTKKDRVRSALLRWHPDKLGILISQTLPEDKEKVQGGIRIVMECLQKLNSQL